MKLVTYSLWRSRMISISSNVFNPTDKLKIQLSVGLNNNEYSNLVNIYETAKGTYISINPNIVVAMKYSIPNKEWEKTDTIYINERNIFTLRTGLHSFYTKLMREDMFAYDTKGYVAEINSNGDANDIETIPLTKGQILRLEPAILYDKQGNSLPGVMMRINMESNEVDLSIDEFEAMMDMFNHINIRQEGMVLLQTYLLLRKTPMKTNLQGNPPQTKSNDIPRRSLFDRPGPNQNQDNEFVKTPVKKNTMADFMNLPEDDIN